MEPLSAAEIGRPVDPMLPRPFRVVRAARETADTYSLALAPADGGGAPVFRPGQFNMVYLFGVGEIALSISSDPTRTGPLIHTVRAVGAVSRGLCAARRGHVVGLRGPFGSAWPVGEVEGNDIVVVAGGIGLAPLRPVIYHLLAHRRSYGRIVILYGARSRADILYFGEIESWRSRFDLQVEVTVDHATGDWLGHVGVVTRLIPRVSFDPANSAAMICGPEVMIRHAARALGERGVPDRQIYVSMERNMKCAVGFCGHCQFGPTFVCKDGPVFPLERIGRLFEIREV